MPKRNAKEGFREREKERGERENYVCHRGILSIGGWEGIGGYWWCKRYNIEGVNVRTLYDSNIIIDNLVTEYLMVIQLFDLLKLSSYKLLL